jgi:hypothetical protein
MRIALFDVRALVLLIATSTLLTRGRIGLPVAARHNLSRPDALSLG